jgi:hypothetical protein
MVASTEKPKSKAWMLAPSASMTTESGRSNAQKPKRPGWPGQARP